MVGYVSDAEIAAQWAIEKAVGVGAKAAWNATVGPAVNAAIDSAWASVFGGAALEGGGVAAGSGLVGGAAGGAGVTGAIAGAFAAFAPAGIALAVFSLLAAIGSKPNYTRTIDRTEIRWDGERFVSNRLQAVGGDKIAARLNDYYAARPFDVTAYSQNNPYAPAWDPEGDQARGGRPNDDPSRIGYINRYIPDIRNPTVGYGVDVGFAGDGLALARGDDVVDSTLRRILMRAGESAESIDAFIGGAGKGAAGGLPLPQTFGLDRRGGAEEPVLDREDFKLQTPDYAVRYQERDFVPLDSYMATPDAEPAKTGPKPPYSDPAVPGWLSSWTMGRDRPTTKPAAVDEKLWTAWNAATPEEQANAWRYIGADPWRELTGLPAA